MYVNLKGQEVYYQKIGNGKDLIMLHGWKQDSSTFWGLVDSLRDDFTLWLIDLPGFGRSDKPIKPFNVANYANIIEEFIKENSLKKPAVLGHSVGGRIAIVLGASNSSSIGKLILEDSAGIKPEISKLTKMFYPIAKTFNLVMPAGRIKEQLRHKVYSSLESDYPEVGELKETFQNILNEDLAPYLPKIKAEALILWGENDRVVPLKYGKRMYRAIPNSRIEVIDEVGHFPHLENPQRFEYYVKDFI